MGFSKLREWVGTVTGKGDRWGRDRLGRSEPAFLRASTTALPHLPALHGEKQADVGLQLLFHCEAGHLWPFVLRPVPGGGCVRLQCSVLRAFLFACHSLPAMPTALNVLAPVQLLQVCLPPFTLLRLPPVPFHVRQDRQLGPAVCQGQQFVRASSLPAARLSRWQLQHGPAVAARAPVHLLTLLPFSCRVHDPGPWV